MGENSPVIRWGVSALLCCVWVSALSAATAVNVVSVRFEDRRLPGQSYPWLEASVKLNPTGAVTAQNVQLKLWLSFNNPTGKYAYMGQAKLTSLSDPATVRFYLPPDVLRAERLSRTPTGYYLEVSSSQGAEPFQPSHASPSMQLGNARQEIKALPAQPLLPHYYTPFYSQPDTFRDLPSYVIP